MKMPAARIMDMHLCVVPAPPPAPPLPPPGVPNTIDVLGTLNVLIGGMPAARVSDMSLKGVPHPISMGSKTVQIMSMPAARVGDQLGCGGLIVPPCCPTVLIGG
ncbi:MAG: PAAR domain-containing protein [Sulfitobacter sp.]